MSEHSAFRRVVLASSIGTAIEWYDFFIYAFLGSLVFDRVFFPQVSSAAGTMAVFATFTVGFLARPLGGVVFGHFGDRLGRKSTLIASMLLMGFATAAIGCLPGFDAIGLWAPALLVVLRFLQGFALGGESVGAVLLTVEGSPAAKRGLFGGLIQAAGPASVVLASLATALVMRLPEDQLLSWGWRIPFLASLALVLVGLYVRARVFETQAFVAARRDVSKVPLFEVLKHHRRPVIIVLALSVAETAFFYLTVTFSLAYGAQLGIEKRLLSDAVLFGNLLSMCAVPVFGALSDRVGRRPVFAGGLATALLFIYPFFLLVQSLDGWAVVTAVVIAAGVIHPLMFGSESSFFAELFPTRVRFTAISVGKQLGTILGGGLAPLVATALMASSGGNILTVVAYFAVLSVLALLAAAVAQETRGREL
ncbi:MFS transporter [Steroidobacter sp.]|uniref:MFS transporter n=1 Tax=Steroidobacter sp. TaxID=1978227 RepID=UPI001A506A12|nr:MFS transporter [Steroidobacter sp.]MBL8269075.1 MHS family MFS transporter [Steroidobacter sp.]